MKPMWSRCLSASERPPLSILLARSSRGGGNGDSSIATASRCGHGGTTDRAAASAVACYGHGATTVASAAGCGHGGRVENAAGHEINVVGREIIVDDRVENAAGREITISCEIIVCYRH